MKEEFPIDYRLYILMRNDLDSMSVGRAAAQASHASNAFIHKYGKRTDVQNWQKQTSQGFGTAIVLSAKLDQINDVLLNIKRGVLLTKQHPYDVVEDPDYGMKTTRELFNLLDTRKYTRYVLSDTTSEPTVTFFRSEITCAYVFGTKQELSPILGHLNLY